MNNKFSFESIEHFSTAADLIREYSETDIDIELMEYIDSLDDYESFDYFVIDGETVIVTEGLCGTASGVPLPVEEFIQNTVDYCRENME